MGRGILEWIGVDTDFGIVCDNGNNLVVPQPHYREKSKKKELMLGNSVFLNTDARLTGLERSIKA